MASCTVEGDPTAKIIYFRLTGFNEGDVVRLYVRRADTQGVAVYDEDIKITSQGSLNGQKVAVDGLTPDTTYSYNCGVRDGTSTDWIYPEGSAPTVTTASETVTVQRPSDWSWTSTVALGASIKLSATEWNNFCGRINEFREYKNLSDYSFTTVYSGTKISATIVNQARSAISSMNSGVPSAVSSGSTITASFFNGLKNALNAIT